MRELLAVEYVSKGESKKEGSDPLHFLDGCRGEVCKKTWLNLRKSKGRPDGLPSHYGGPQQSSTIIARFPLAIPGGVIKLYPSWGFGDDDLEEQGIKLPVSSLRVVSKTPISRFTLLPWSTGQDVTGMVFERDNYVKFHSLETLRTCLNYLPGDMKHTWLWYSESHADAKNVFMGARIYGIDKIIPSYAPTKFRGIAVQVFTRPVKDTVERLRSDVYIVSNTDEYVSYVDGVEIKRNDLGNNSRPSNVIDERYPSSRFHAPSDLLAKSDVTNKDDQAKLMEAMAEAASKANAMAKYMRVTTSTSSATWGISTSSTGNY